MQFFGVQRARRRVFMLEEHVNIAPASSNCSTRSAISCAIFAPNTPASAAANKRSPP